MSTLTRRITKGSGAGLVAAALVAAVAFGPAAAAAEPSPHLSAAQAEQIRTRMADAGVPEAARPALFATVNRGELLESQVESSTPVSRFVEQREDGVRTVSVFADGSRRWREQQTARPLQDAALRSAIDPALTECASVGGWNVNCKVGISDLVSDASFRIDYSADAVRDYRAAECTNSIGPCSISGGVMRATSDSSGPAWAELRFEAGIIKIGNVVNGAFGIRVHGSSVELYGS